MNRQFNGRRCGPRWIRSASSFSEGAIPAQDRMGTECERNLSTAQRQPPNLTSNDPVRAASPCPGKEGVDELQESGKKAS